MPKIPVPHSPSLGDVGDCGRLRCVHNKADTTITCVSIHVLLVPPSVLRRALVLWLQFSWCVVYGPNSVGIINPWRACTARFMVLGL